MFEYVNGTDDDFLICSDCANHIANGEGGCCHNPEHETYTGPFADVPCEVSTRMERTWRRKNIVDVTLNYVEEGDDAFYSTRTCESCGDTHYGDRITATATVRHIADGRRLLRRNGWIMVITQYGNPMSVLYISGRNPGTGQRFGEHVGHYSGKNRYQALFETLTKNGII